MINVHTASHKPARRRHICQQVTSDRYDDGIRFVFGVACYVCRVPSRDAKPVTPKRNGGQE